MVRRCLRLATLLAGLSCALATACHEAPPAETEAPPAPAGSSIRGSLRIAAFGGAATRTQGTVQRSVWSDGPAYAGMEDNDLRGFLDGHAVFDWNQPTQVHVRAGRWRSSPRGGEYEIFRTLQRWSGVRLPRDARVRRAALRVAVEEGPEEIERLAVMLYEVKKDWQPGNGGRKHDNTSPPLPGEVVWNERAHGEERWTLPGASFASDFHPAADTGAGPLAEAEWVRGGDALVFESPALAAYVERRARAGRPLLFLLKLADAQEDRRKSVLLLYSANVDTVHNPERRPRLTVDWESEGARATWERSLHLEHGREWVLPDLDVAGAALVAVSFVPDGDSDEATLEIREGGEGAPWRAFPPVFPPRAGRLALRVRALRDPLARGEAFTATFRNTWVRTGEPHTRQVEWTFVAPSGDVHRRAAAYEGDFTWTVRFEPEELGRWRAFYRHDLSGPYRSADAVFDVVPGTCAAVAEQLRALPGRIEARYPAEENRRSALAYFGSEFWQLERAAAACAAPGSSGPGTPELREAIAAVRRVLMPWDDIDAPPGASARAPQGKR